MKRNLAESVKKIQAIVQGAEQKFVLLGSFAEAKVNKESRIAEVTVIKKGWSKNGYYYGDRALQDIAKHINEGTASRVFLDHNSKANLFEPRKNEDHIANNIECRHYLVNRRQQWRLWRGVVQIETPMPRSESTTPSHRLDSG